MDPSQNAYEVTTPLLRQVPQAALDAVFGAAGLVTADLKLSVVGRSWDEFMARSGRSDLARNALLGSSILLFFRNDEQRRVFESLLHSMHSDELGVHNQVVDLGTKEKPFYVQLHVQGLWQDGVFAGYFVHCLDITREHTNRLMLIERDREFQSLKEAVEKAETSARELQEKLRVSAEEIAQREAQLKKVTEKSMRMERSSREALEHSEKAVEKSARLQHELDKLRKQQSENTQAAQELEKQSAECTRLTRALETAQAKCDTLEQELQTSIAQRSTLEQELQMLRESQNGQAEGVANAAQEIAALQATLGEMTGMKDSLEQEYQKLLQENEQSRKETAELRAALEELRSNPVVVAAPPVQDTSSAELLTMISLPACSLDLEGKLVCATGSFWEELGSVPEQGVGQSFADWLSDNEAARFAAWLESQTDACCDVTAADGSSWRACAVVGSNGTWQSVIIEAGTAAAAVQPLIQPAPHAATGPSQVRALSRELADEFSNLLTGVLGHASLAAAEMDSHTSRDIIAIEQTAREAAQLVRKLAALSGSGKHVQDNDLAKMLKQYVKKMPPEFYGVSPQLVLCDDACLVHGDTGSLKMVLEAISAHARDKASEDAQVCYTLSRADEDVCLSLSYNGSAGYPAGWHEGQPPSIGQSGWDLIFAREVVRGMGGEIELTDDGERTMLLMTMPLVNQEEQVRNRS
ncbi:hypothetical protein KJZ99_08150 [bacterium]|nr:hypothetical protein [bacterium]